MITNLCANNIESIKIVRTETENANSQLLENKYITVHIILKDKYGKELSIAAFSKSHDNWTDACKELNIGQLFLNTVIIENSEEMWNEPVQQTLTNY